MKRSELIKHIPVPEKREKCICVELFRSCGKDVLMVSGYVCPYYGYESRRIYTVHFVWESGYLTWNEGGQWTRESVYSAGFHEIGRKIEEVGEFLKKAGDTCSCGINEFEESLRYREKEARERRKQKRIDEIVRKMVPPLPGGFERRISSMASGIGNGEVMNVKLFQRNAEGKAVERMFRVEKCQSEKDSGNIRTMEICDAFEENFGRPWEYWLYGQKSGRYGRGQSFWTNKRGVVGNLPKTYRVYDNLEQIGMTKAQASCLRAMDGKADPWFVIETLEKFPEYEKVIKAGMTRLARDISEVPELNAMEMLRWIGRKDRQTREKIGRFNAGYNAAKIIAEHPELRDKWAEMIAGIKSEYKIGYVDRIADFGLNLNHVFTLLDKTGGVKQSTMQAYIDYLQMAHARGSDIHDEIIYRNKRWREFHDEYIEEENRRRAELTAMRDAEEARKRKKEYSRKFAGIWRDYKRNKAIFAWEKGEYCILVPRSYAEIIDEGQMQHHCVGSCGGHYMDNMARRKTWIVFLRRKENPGKPWYTVETDGKTVLQFYAAYDRQPEKKIVQKLLTEWMKLVRKNKKKVEEQEEKDRKSQKLAEAGRAAGAYADHPVMVAVS